jgi:tetratricopeptide (TPR) repeat protein
MDSMNVTQPIAWQGWNPRRRGEVSQGERENAERLLRDALRRDGTCVRALTLLGFSMMERREGEGVGELDERMDKAEKLFQRGLQLSDGDARSSEGLGRCKVHRGALEEAEGVYQRALDSNPQDAGLLRSYAELLSDGGVDDARGAFLLWEAAIRSDPADVDSMLNVARHVKGKLKGKECAANVVERNLFKAAAVTEFENAQILEDLGMWVLETREDVEHSFAFLKAAVALRSSAKRSPSTHPPSASLLEQTRRCQLVLDMLASL